MIATPSTAPPTGKSLWPAGIITFFVGLAVFNVILLIVAYKNRPDQVVANPYEASLVYENVIRKERLSQQLGVKLSLNTTSASPEGIRTVTLQVQSAAPPDHWTAITLSAQRPSDEHLDTREIALTQTDDDPSLWRAEVPLSAAGMWLFTVTLRDRQDAEALVRMREILQ